MKIPGTFLCVHVDALCVPMTKLEIKLTCFPPQDLLGFSLAPLFPHSLRKSRSGQDYEAGSGGSPGSNFGSNAGLTNVHHLWKIKSKVLVFSPPYLAFGVRDSAVYLKIETFIALHNYPFFPASKNIWKLLMTLVYHSTGDNKKCFCFIFSVESDWPIYIGK